MAGAAARWAKPAGPEPSLSLLPYYAATRQTRPGSTVSMAASIDGTSGLRSHAIGPGANDHDTKGQCGNVVLERYAAVHPDESLVVTPHPAQQLAIVDPGPAATDHGVPGVN